MMDDTNPPQKLYRYLSFESEYSRKNLENIISDNKIRFSGIEELNDPFDCRPKVNTDKPEFEEQFENMIAEIRRKSGVLCLTEKKDNILMWSYYGKHAGVCLEFDTGIPEIFNKDKTTFYPIHYPDDNKYPVITVNRETADRIGTEEFKKELSEKMMCWKSIDWKYEEEWRVVAYRCWQKENCECNFKPQALTGIIMGVNITQEDEEFVKELLRKTTNKKILLYKAKLRESEYALEILRLE